MLDQSKLTASQWMNSVIIKFMK